MSEELSRVKSRKNNNKGKHPSKSINSSQTLEGAPIAKRQTRASSSTLSRRGSRLSTSINESSKRSNNEHNDESVPSRTDTYISERVRLSKMFVNSLIFIFVILLIILLWWGIEGAPPLKTLW